MQDMIKEVCQKFGINPSDIKSTRKDKNTASAKKVVYYVLRKSGLSFNQIGRAVNKNHETVLATLRNISQELTEYADKVSELYTGISEELNKQQIYKQRRVLIELLNKGLKLKQIIKETNLSPEFIQEQVQFFYDNEWIKKVPNYKNCTYKMVFYEKDLPKNRYL